MSKKRKLAIPILLPALVVLGIVGGGVGVWEYHKQPQSCAVCHIIRPYYESWKNSVPLANAHAQAEVACLDCHPQTLEEQMRELTMYVKEDYETPLRTRRMPMEFCLDCHMDNEHTSYEQVMERTKDYIIEGDNINPHDPHPGLAMPQFECRVCHKMHQESPEIEYCYGCHHEGQFPKGCEASGCHEDEF